MIWVILFGFVAAPVAGLLVAPWLRRSASKATLVGFVCLMAIAVQSVAGLADGPAAQTIAPSVTTPAVSPTPSPLTTDSDPFFNKQFRRDALIAAIAVLFGIPAGLWINRRMLSKTSAQQEQEKRDRRRTLAEAIRNTIDHNVTLVGAVNDMLNMDSAPTFPLDLTLLDSTAALKYDVLANVELCIEIDTLRFELCHFDMKLRQLLAIHFDAAAIDFIHDSQGVPYYKKFRAQLDRSIRDQLPTVVKHLRSAGKALNAYLGALG